MWINLTKEQIDIIRGALLASADKRGDRQNISDELARQVFARAAQDEAWIDRASDQYADEGVIEIDENAVVSESDDGGAYVMAWVYAEKEVE